MLEFLDEVTGFDKMPHDDQVDSFTQALIDLKVSDVRLAVQVLGYSGIGFEQLSKVPDCWCDAIDHCAPYPVVCCREVFVWSG